MPYSKGLESNTKKTRLIYLKSIIKAMIFALIAFLILAVLVTFTSISENIVSLITSIVMVLSIAYSGLLTAIKKEKNGLVQGLITGAMYVLLIIFLCWALDRSFSMDKIVLLKAVLGIISGGLGGMIGVNLK